MGDLVIFALAIALSSITAAVATWSVTKSNADIGAQPNSVAGLRTRATKSSPQAWVAGHRAAVPPAKVTMVISVVAAVASLLCCLAALALDVTAMPAAVLAVAAMLAVVVGSSYSCLVADRAARVVRAVDDPATR